MGTAKYSFRIEEFVHSDVTGKSDWEEVAAGKGAAKFVIRNLIAAIETIADDNDIDVQWPGSSAGESEPSAAEFQELLQDPGQRQIMESMFGSDMMAGLDNMAKLASLMEGQPKKARQS